MYTFHHKKGMYTTDIKILNPLNSIKPIYYYNDIELKDNILLSEQNLIINVDYIIDYNINKQIYNIYNVKNLQEIQQADRYNRRNVSLDILNTYIINKTLKLIQIRLYDTPNLLLTCEKIIAINGNTNEFIVKNLRLANNWLYPYVKLLKENIMQIKIKI